MNRNAANVISVPGFGGRRGAQADPQAARRPSRRSDAQSARRAIEVRES